MPRLCFLSYLTGSGDQEHSNPLFVFTLVPEDKLMLAELPLLKKGFFLVWTIRQALPVIANFYRLCCVIKDIAILDEFMLMQAGPAEYKQPWPSGDSVVVSNQ